MTDTVRSAPTMGEEHGNKSPGWLDAFESAADLVTELGRTSKASAAHLRGRATVVRPTHFCLVVTTPRRVVAWDTHATLTRRYPQNIWLTHQGDLGFRNGKWHTTMPLPLLKPIELSEAVLRNHRLLEAWIATIGALREC